MSASPPRVVVVHERFTEFAGSEAVVEQLARTWPDAPLLAPVARPGVLPADLEPRVRSTALSRLLRGSTYAHLLPALPVAVRRLRVPASADVVIASHHAFATQVVHATSAPVVAYVHSPARWVWDPQMRQGEAGGTLGQLGLAGFAAAFRRYDREAAAGVHTLVANSSEVADRIHRWWGRDAQVVHPPVDIEYYTPATSPEREDFFLLAGRMVPYKRPDLAVRAAARAGVPLVVAGDGRSRAQVEALAGPHTRFVGRVSDDDLRDLYRRCRALLMPGVEDFGIVPVEAQACGAPVVAIGEGGAKDSVLPGVTGHLVPPSDSAEPGAELDAWSAALARFDPSDYDPGVVRRHAETFSRTAFRDKMTGVVGSVLDGS